MDKINIDTRKCIGCALCVSIAPKTFKMGKNGKAEIKDSNDDSNKKIKEAIIFCPVEAISQKG